MNRRQVIAGALTIPVTALATEELLLDKISEDAEKYWRAQWQIGEYEQERTEMHSHMFTQKMNKRYNAPVV